ncbi:zinc-binding dehydrogenase [Nocardia sp. SYP-A9097]|uniref:zinc-binding dehydrogenase n=1 Tax=Nocardia sp. SYP-A9097 TaxID=2663237 RepID=UPI0018919A33|nr:zinc-binding dehydrogenase [Nocardia sp. SYP-A9097]
MRGFVTDPAGRAGLRLAQDLPEPVPAADGIVVAVKAYAIAAGARVTAQVSGPGRVEEAYALGAHRVVTSLEDDTLGPFHLILDGIGGPLLSQAIRRVAAGGHLAWYGNVGGVAELRLGDFFGYAQGWNAHIVGFISPVPEEMLGEDLGILADLVADGRLRPHIGRTDDWTRTPEAFEALADRSLRGKAVLTLDR